MVRSPVTSVSFNPHSANSMAATLQVVLCYFKDMRAALDDFCIVRSDKSTLIRASSTRFAAVPHVVAGQHRCPSGSVAPANEPRSRQARALS